ncbi:FG-GAP repeat domain-containing protein [Microbacterium sp. NPDC056057]|uniref:FG-GAP repeat domain-containing protein n=1 Tax=Microbacterium sp. NPDC056057 TaxID=3345699 RepID=UPI0035E1E425
MVVSLVAALLLAPGVASAAGQAATGTPGAGVAGDIVKTADLSQFQPGNIISDGVFFDSGTMTETQIQQFLEAKVPQCQAGYTCLRDWYDTPRTTSADAMCGAYAGGVRERASTIIHKVARACGINPQVILVTLQKEQGLVTHVWPSEWRYTIAMGQGCPDTAACDTRYYGFFNQVFGAAWQLKRYANPPGTSQYFTWYAPGKTWNLRYHPNVSCGSSPVYVQNQATANLYYYTPYQPNAAALRAGYAEANDPCSSYGNRNFYNYFTDWFGSTQVRANVCAPPAESAITVSGGLFVVNADQVNARMAPTTECVDGGRLVSADTLVVRTGTYSGWDRVTFDGVSSWIRADLLTPLSATPVPTLSLDDTRHIFALTSAGSVLAYPFSKVGQWGSAVTVLSGQNLKQIVAVGDLDADGHRDLIGVDGQNRALLYRGDGASFSGPITLPVDWSRMRLVTGAGDFDGDGTPDVFTANADGSLQLWRGDRKGSFRSPIVVGNGWGTMTLLAGGADFSGDGAPDLLARDMAGRLHVYEGDGRGSWSTSAPIGQGWGSISALLAPGDFTGDGRADVLARDSAGGLHLYPGMGGGVGYLSQIGAGWGGMLSIVGPGAAVGAPAPRAQGPGAGDVSGDGNPDVVALGSNGLLLYRGNGAGGWLSASVADASWPSSARIVPLGDFDNDAARDLGRIGADGTFTLMAGNGDGTFRAPVAIGNGWSGLDTVFGGIDYDGDGKVDVIARDAGGRLLLYRGNGAGGWASGGSVIGWGWEGFDSIVNAGDFDGDGRSDILARVRTTGALVLYPTNGKGGWGEARQIGNGWGAFTSLFSPGDFDGDGEPDVLVRTAAGDVLLYRGDGRGGWRGSVKIGWGWAGFSQLY